MRRLLLLTSKISVYIPIIYKADFAITFINQKNRFTGAKKYENTKLYVEFDKFYYQLKQLQFGIKCNKK